MQNLPAPQKEKKHTKQHLLFKPFQKSGDKYHAGPDFNDLFIAQTERNEASTHGKPRSWTGPICLCLCKAIQMDQSNDASVHGKLYGLTGLVAFQCRSHAVLHGHEQGIDVLKAVKFWLVDVSNCFPEEINTSVSILHTVAKHTLSI